jgi:hypothetical protein
MTKLSLQRYVYNASGSVAGLLLGLSSGGNRNQGLCFAVEGGQLRGLLVQDQEISSDKSTLQVTF